MTIAELLAAARDAHTRYRAAVPRMVPDRAQSKLVQASGDPAIARAQMAEALRLREEAEAADPEHRDLAWADEQTTQFRHAALVNFYREQLAPKPDGIPA